MSLSRHYLIAFSRPILALLIIAAVGGRGSTSAQIGAGKPTLRLAYVLHGNIWVLDEPSGTRLQVTSDGHDSAPSWTRAGRALLFQRQSHSRILTMRWQPGGGIRRLRAGLWSPDGAAVAFTREVPGGSSATTVWIARQGRLIRITPPERGYRWSPLAWSSDSRQLALGRFTILRRNIPPIGPASLWLANATPSPVLRRLPLPASASRQLGWPDVVVWSPNGRYLAVGVGPDQACVSCRADGEPFFVLPVSGGAAVPLGVALHPDETLSWAPDGSFLVLSVPGGRETYVDKHLIRVDLATRTRHPLTANRRFADIEPAISPNGRRVAFVRGRSALGSPHLTPVQLIVSRRLVVMDTDGSHLRPLASAPGWTDDAPIWTSDGRWLVFVRWHRREGGRSAAATLWAIGADGGAPQRLAQLDLPAGFFDGFGYYGIFGWKGLFAVAPARVR